MSSYFTTILIFMASLALISNLLCDGTVCATPNDRLADLISNFNGWNNFVNAFYSDPTFWGAVGVIAITGLITSNIFLTVVAPFVLIVLNFAIPVKSILNSITSSTTDSNTLMIVSFINLVFNGLLFISAMQLFVGRGDV